MVHDQFNTMLCPISNTVKVFHLKMKMTDVRQTVIHRQPQSPFTSVKLQNDVTLMKLNGD